MSVFSSYTPPSVGGSSSLITIETVIGGTPTIINSIASAIGLTNGSNVISFSDFQDKQVEVLLGSTILPNISTGGSDTYCTKNINENFLTINNGTLATGDYLKIKVYT